MPQITASWRIGVIGVIDGGQRLIACVSGRLGGARDGARATSEDASSAPIASVALPLAIGITGMTLE